MFSFQRLGKFMAIAAPFVAFSSVGGQFPLIGGLAASAATLDNFKSSDKSPQNNADDRVQQESLTVVSEVAPSKTQAGLRGPAPEITIKNTHVNDPVDVVPADAKNFDCSTLQQLSENSPATLEGSDLARIKDDCDEGIISTAEEVARAIEEYEAPNPSMDDQIDITATGICENAPTLMDDQVMKEIKEACEEDPRKNEHIVDLAGRLQAPGTSAQGDVVGVSC